MMKWYRYVKPYLAYFIIGPVCMLVEVAGEVIMPKMLSVVINDANAAYRGHEPYYHGADDSDRCTDAAGRGRRRVFCQ